MNAPDPRSKKKSCNNASNPRKQRQIRVSYTCFVWWGKKKKTRALGNGSKDRSLKRDNDSMDLKTEDVGRRSPFRTALIFLYPTSSLFPDHLLLFFGTKATLNSRRNAWIWTGVRCPHTSLVCVCVCVCAFLPLIVLLKFWLHGLCSKTALTAQTLRFKRIFRWNNNSYISRNTGMVTDNDVMFFYIGSRCFVFN